MSWNPCASTARRITIGPGDFNPPEYYDDGSREPTTETVWKFDRFRVVNGKMCEVSTAVEVDTKTHAVVKYGRKRALPIASCFRYRVEAYASKHPRSGPKMMAWMDEHWGAPNAR